ncbi:MAG: pentapeptide repeat-containing protein [Clostridia bacterium]|nr:pentapeptide repeat-containing protein [Clostridia bacterium]
MYIRSLKECKYSHSNKPETWQEFEELVRDCAAVQYGKEFRLYGRQGQDQHGIDIYSIDREYLIQCKDYDNSKSLSCEDMENAYNLAKEHFKKKEYKMQNGILVEITKPLFKHFIFAVSFDRDTHTEDNRRILAEKAAEDGVEIDVLFWPDIVGIIENYRIHNNNDEYIKGFSEPLFLHGKDKRVCLDNLFVMQEYRELLNSIEYGVPKDDLENRLKRFIDSDKSKMLVIEGDAGSGKSSLVGWINCEAKSESDSQNEHPRDTFDGRTVHTVRLRDLSGDLKKTDFKIGPAVLDHMHIDSKSDLVRMFPKGLMVLDGFDELCMVQGLSNYEHKLLELLRWLPDDYKVILTSRPRYIRASELAEKCSFISLQHFSAEKRGKWLDKFKALLKEEAAIDPRVEEYIRSIGDENVSNICDTPLTLYLLAGGKVTIGMTNNIWELYHFIFRDAIPDAEYSKQMDYQNGDGHPVSEIKDSIYRLTQEIALKMHCSCGERLEEGVKKTEDGAFLITESGIADAARRLGETEVDTSKLVRGHALCCYWRTEKSRDYAEFYHNNIRDFFMCERIFAELNKAYNSGGSRDDIKEKVAKWFVDVFKHGEPNGTVLLFLSARAEHAVKNELGDEFPLKEREMRLLPDLYEYMLLEGMLYDGLGVRNHIRAIENILLGAALVYRHIYDFILEDGEYVKWWNDPTAVNKSSMIGYVFDKIVGRVGVRAELFEVDLRGAYLRHANLQYADLRSAYLCDAYLSGADLSGANMSGADLHESNLRGANMSGANMSGANLYRSNLRDAVLHGADLHGANLGASDLTRTSLAYTNLRNADLTYTDLRSANLLGADFSDASLVCTTLPSKFRRNNQD